MPQEDNKAPSVSSSNVREIDSGSSAESLTLLSSSLPGNESNPLLPKIQRPVINGIEILEDGSYIDLSQELSEQEIERKSSRKHKFLVFLFDSLDKHPKERAFLYKLDFFLLSASMLGYFIKSLNQSNVSTAYINGMKEYYGMNANQYNYLHSLWTVGYIIGQIPSNLILHRISARYYLAGLESLWAILTLLMIYPQNLQTVYLIRFLVGLTESGYFPGVEYLIGSWYSPKELTKRSTVFACASTAAGLVSGPLQQRILTSNWSQNSLQPFQWMFVIDFCISVPVALYTFIVYPNTPSTTNAFYFSNDDKRVALERRRRIGAQLNTKEPFTLSKIKSFFTTWHIYVFPVLFLCFNNAGQPSKSQALQLWIKKTLELDSFAYNIYPIGISAGGIVYALLVAYTNDYFQSALNPIFLYFMFFCVTISCALLAYWDIPLVLHWAAYFIIGIPLSSGQPLIFSWVNRILAHDDMKRNFLVVCTNTLAYVTGAWVPLITFDQTDAPEFFIGFTYTTFLGILGAVMTTAVLILNSRDEKKKSIQLKEEEGTALQDLIV